MIKELFTNRRPSWGHYMLAFLALLILVVGAGLAQRLSSRVSGTSNLDLVAGQPLDSGKAVSASSKSVHPSGDLRSADVILGFGDATALAAYKIMSEDYSPFNINITPNETVFFNTPKKIANTLGAPA